MVASCPFRRQTCCPHVDRPVQAVVLSIHEKSEIQTLDHSQAGLLLNLIRCGTTIHDYKRDGRTTLLVALNAFDGSFVGGCVQRYWQKKSTISSTPLRVGQLIEAVVETYATHKAQT